MIPGYKTLRESGAKPRVHGNGFLQLDLPDGGRLHIWDEGLPKQKVSSSIHDHAFGFLSHVLTGRLVNIEYELIMQPKGEYDILVPVRQEGTENTKLEPSGKRAFLEEVDANGYVAGESYVFPPYKFHDTICHGLTATIIYKTHRGEREPRILIPHGESPDNDFDRESFDPETLWPFVVAAIEKERYEFV